MKQQQTIYIRPDLTMLAVDGDRQIEFQLGPLDALKFARNIMAAVVMETERQAAIAKAQMGKDENRPNTGPH